MTDQEIIGVVSALNDEIYTNLGEEYYAFQATFDGTSSHVLFLGNTIWRKDEDERTYDEESDSYEPLGEFLRRHAKEEIEKLSQIWTTPSPIVGE